MKRFPLALAAPALFVATAAAQTPFKLNRNAPLPPYHTGYDVCIGDVDGDGDVDLVVGNDHAPNQLFLNDGRGGFVDATAGRLPTPTTPPVPGNPFLNATYEVDLADIDGDLDLDLLLVNDHDLPNRVYVNNGLGFFTDATATALPNHMEWSVDQVVADFDGDGDVDWFVSNMGQQSRLYLNNGAGVFSDASANLPANVRGDVRSFAEDLDQDGDLDLVLVRAGFYLVASPQVLVNQGGAVFAIAPVALGGGLAFPADVDGDGRVDLVANGASQVYHNQGGLVFAPSTLLTAPMSGSLDYDGDGDADLMGANALALNNGTGTFTTVASGVNFFTYDAFCVADLDGDGDQDVATNLSTSSAFINFRTQVHTPAAPAIAQPYEIQLHGGTAAAPVLFGLGVSFAGTAIPLPPLGTLRLDLTQGQLLGGVLATATPTPVTWTIPNNPVFIGFQLHYQAIVFAPGRPPFLSNSLRDFVQ